MAKYTVELGDLAKSGFKIFDFPYDFYDPAKKTDFEQKFINHFYFREIGQETPARFRHYLRCKLDERLPYYNEILKLTQLEYDILNPYSITETMEKTNANTKTSTGNTNNTLNRTAGIVSTGEKTNSLDSETEHTENTTDTKHETQIESGKLDKTSTMDVDNKKVGSDTPNGLLTMEDLSKNVYATTADIEDGTTKTVDGQTNSATKEDTSTDTTNSTVTDTINATSHDSTTDTHDETTKETNAATITQNENDNGTENYNLHRVGHIGVQTKSELLEKHIELLGKMQTVLTAFFDECEDLFMQLY